VFFKWLICVNGQESFNDSKGLGAEFQFFGFADATILSPIIDYKMRNIISLLKR
jgi:hypothetical protein